ncbi:Ig-like domain-containing protein [Candidatus Dactylopiibacterium carminicum]|uniref:Ig-like domain-containing protein n=1 Tax=Candidatus Dactylopiibacterium carminicum TaxID=857335 RepID=UPI001CC2B313|nr:Ig-like domain-containing protein [Candidatus Dactylopiibacterium carminicum]
MGQLNNPPVAVADVATTRINTAVFIDALANDTDKEGDPLSFRNVTIADEKQGEVAQDYMDDKFVIKYTPAPGFTGTAIIHYVVADARGDTDSSYVTVTVTP